MLVYPSLAATLGLEEATLLTVLSDFSATLVPATRNNYAWYQVNSANLYELTPFWQPQDLQRILKNLRDKGVLLIASADFSGQNGLKFAFNEKAGNVRTALPRSRQAAAQPEPAAIPTPNNSQAQGKNFIPPHWQPDKDTLAQLAQHNIPSHFAYEQVPNFVTYWRERAEAHRSWGAKFVSHTIHKWREYETLQHKKGQQQQMYSGWQPSQDAMEIMTKQAGIPVEFIEDAIDEFILYWKERGDAGSTWNTKFIQHVRLQWAKYHAVIENNSEPKVISGAWRPSADVYDILRLANIDLAYAESLIGEFVLYWRDSGQVHTSWNTRFLQYVKRQWAKRHALANGNEPSGGHRQRSTRDLSLEEQLNDRSWAS